MEIAKKAERDAEEKELVASTLGDLEIANLTWENYYRARNWAADIFEIQREDDEL